MQDLREARLPEMSEFVSSWAVINHMRRSQNYLNQLEDQMMNESKTGNGFELNPAVIPTYFAAVMGLRSDRLFLAIMKQATRCGNYGNIHIRGTESFDGGLAKKYAIGRDSTSESRRYTSSNEYEYDMLVEQLAEMIHSFARLSIYHHYDRELLNAVRDNPESIMRLISEGSKMLPDEMDFFERLRILAESIISIIHPGWNSFSSDLTT